MTDDELSELRAAAEAKPVLWMSPNSHAAIGQVDESGAALHVITTTRPTAAWNIPLYANPATILRLLAHVEALTAQVAERDNLLREIRPNVGTYELGGDLIDRFDALLGGER